jgi:flagellar motor switch protein FliG
MMATEPFMKGNNNRAIAAYQSMLAPKATPTSAESLAKSVKPIQKPAPSTPPSGVPINAGESKFTRVAKFLILIGADEAANILAELPEDQVERISKEIALIRGITPEEAACIKAEFAALLAGASGGYKYGGAQSGGVEEARRLLYAAFGPERGERLLRRAVPQTLEGAFKFLEDYKGDEVAMLLHDESAATGALILSHINPALAASALKAASPAWRKEVVRRIGHLKNVSPEVLEQVATGLKEKAHKLGQAATDNLDGMNALAAILKNADISFSDKILNDLSLDDAALSGDIKERLYTLDDVVRSDDKPIQEKLHTMSDHDIALLIKGRPDDFAHKILSNISAHRRSLVRDEDVFLGPVPRKDTEAVAREFMAWYRAGRQSGAILGGGDDVVE